LGDRGGVFIQFSPTPPPLFPCGVPPPPPTTTPDFQGRVAFMLAWSLVFSDVWVNGAFEIPFDPFPGNKELESKSSIPPVT